MNIYNKRPGVTERRDEEGVSGTLGENYSDAAEK